MPDHPLSVFAAAREAPARDALVWEGAAWSYATLAAVTAAHCDALRALGAGPGVRVTVQADNRPATVCALLALMELGAAAVLLHPRLTEGEARAQRDDAAPALAYAPDDLAPGAATPPRAHPDGDALALLFTSGSSGRAKAAALPRAAFVASARASAANLGWRDDDRWLLCLPVCHVGGLSVLTRSLVARRCVVLHPRFDAAAVLTSVVRDRATLLSVVPTMLRALLDADGADALRRLRAVLVGGAATPLALLEACAARRVRALTTYGLTEACSQVTTQRLPPDGAPFTPRPGSGPALEGVELAVVRDDGAPADVGEVGRIRVRGPSVMTGYLGQAPLAGAWLDTGDLGSFDAERSLHVAARRTDLIVTGGENVYPAEVEAALCEIDGVRAAVVFGVPDDVWGQRVAAAIVRDRTDDPRDDDAWLAAAWASVTTRLASHKRPRRVCVVPELAARATGKVDRAAVARAATPLLRAFGVTRGAGVGYVRAESMTRATEFLMGSADPQGRTVETLLRADDHWLEMRHDWVQWAFPNQDPSAFNDDAPVWTEAEARALPPAGRANLLRLLARFERFLGATSWWRRRSDHNHARITRVILCLRDAGLRDEALAFHGYVTAAPEPGPTSRAFWRAAADFSKPFSPPGW